MFTIIDLYTILLFIHWSLTVSGNTLILTRSLPEVLPALTISLSVKNVMLSLAKGISGFG